VNLYAPGRHDDGGGLADGPFKAVGVDETEA
jgi:hypothetical protein